MKLIAQRQGNNKLLTDSAMRKRGMKRTIRVYHFALKSDAAFWVTNGQNIF